MTELDTILKLWPLLSAAGAALGALIMGCLFWHLSKRFVRRDEHEALQEEVKEIQASVDGVGKQLGGLSGQLNALQSRLDNLPTQDKMNKILLGMEELRGTQKEMAATMRGQAEVLKRIEHPVQLMMGEAIKKGTK